MIVLKRNPTHTGPTQAYIVSLGESEKGARVGEHSHLSILFDDQICAKKRVTLHWSEGGSGESDTTLKVQGLVSTRQVGLPSLLASVGCPGGGHNCITLDGSPDDHPGSKEAEWDTPRHQGHKLERSIDHVDRLPRVYRTLLALGLGKLDFETKADLRLQIKKGGPGKEMICLSAMS